MALEQNKKYDDKRNKCSQKRSLVTEESSEILQNNWKIINCTYTRGDSRIRVPEFLFDHEHVILEFGEIQMHFLIK